jgi:hypothetical protein
LASFQRVYRPKAHFIMKNPDVPAGATAAMEEASAALADLRDALGELSLALNDLLFEADDERRKIAETRMLGLLKKCSGGRPSSR